MALLMSMFSWKDKKNIIKPDPAEPRYALLRHESHDKRMKYSWKKSEWSIAETISCLSWDLNPVCPDENPML